MFRKTVSTKRSTRDLGIQFRDGHGVSTHAERSDRRLEAARNAAAQLLHI